MQVMHSQLLGSTSIQASHVPFQTASSQRARLPARRTSKAHQRPCRSIMTSASSKTVLVPLGNGSEEMEAVTIIDVLRRAGAEVTVASVEKDLTVECSRQVRIVADKLIQDVAKANFDIIVLPVRHQGCLCFVACMLAIKYSSLACCKIYSKVFCMTLMYKYQHTY